MSDITMITYPLAIFLLAKLITKLNLNISRFASFIVFTGAIVSFSYWFHAISIPVWHPVALIAYFFYLVVSFIIFFLFSKNYSPIITFSASLLFMYTLLRYWEFPSFIMRPTFDSIQTTPVLILWCFYGLTLMWLLLKPQTQQIKYLLMGLAVLFIFHFSFHNSGLSQLTGFYGNEIYFMTCRVLGAYFLYQTFKGVKR